MDFGQIFFIIIIVGVLLVLVYNYMNALANPSKSSMISRMVAAELNKDSSIKVPSLHDQYSEINKKELGISTQIKSSFVNVKYHQDYTHVLSALNNLVPRVKVFFNVANIPVTIANPNISDVSDMVDSFINLLNTTITEEVSSFRQSNTGWDEQLVEPNHKSGWDKAQEKLGLVSSLYKKPVPKMSVQLIDIQNMKKYETDDEVKYLMDIIVQNPKSSVQMSFKIGFVCDLRDAKNENNFYKVQESILDIKIEDLFVNGFYVDDPNLVFSGNMEDPGNPEYEKYDMENNFIEGHNLTDSKYIQAVLLDKYAQRSIESRQRNAQLDEEGRDYHNSLPKLFEYDNIYATQTIFDDMNSKRTFS